MPLNQAIPTIDDRSFDSLLAEVRTRIARYTPEWTPVWTDHNDNDDNNEEKDGFRHGVNSF